MGALKQENYHSKNTEIFNQSELKSLSQNVFSDAVRKANQGRFAEALDLCQEALVYANLSQSYLRVYLHRLMAYLSLETGKLNNARIHCFQGIQALNIRNTSYQEDKEYFEVLQALVESRMQKNHLKIV